MLRAYSLAIAAAAVAFIPCRATAATFNFEDLPAGTNVTAQYGSRGVIFFGAYIAKDQRAHSGTQVLLSLPPTAEVFTPAPLVMTFTGPQAHVAFHAANYPGATGAGTLKVFAANGTVLAQDGPKSVPNNSLAASFDVSDPGKRIVRAEFQLAGTAFEVIDDLVIEGTIGPDPGTPAVVITNPVEGVVLPEGPISFRGTVTGDSLLNTLTLSVAIGQPPESTAPPSENQLSLAGSGTNRTFALDYNALMGPYTVTALATNTANRQASATLHFDVLDATIAIRYGSNGPASLGKLLFGTSRDVNSVTQRCWVAVFEKGLIGLYSHATFISTGAIFQKWLATREFANPMSKLGCPTAEQRSLPNGTTAQEFQHGRVYASGNTATYVPEVFRDAIETLGGEDTTGIPVSDPTDSTAAMETWLFQRFARPGQSVEPSTLEIRGSPPILYVERVGDGLADLQNVGIALSPTTATVVRTFKCTGNLGPCAVQKPGWSPTISDGGRYCGGRYPITTLTEWHWMERDYTQTAIGGWVQASQMSCTGQSSDARLHRYQRQWALLSYRCLSVGLADIHRTDEPVWQHSYIRPELPGG